MYIYLIKYYDEIIAAADGDKKANEVISQFILKDNSAKSENFTKIPIRFFSEEK